MTFAVLMVYLIREIMKQDCLAMSDAEMKKISDYNISNSANSKICLQICHKLSPASQEYIIHWMTYSVLMINPTEIQLLWKACHMMQKITFQMVVMQNSVHQFISQLYQSLSITLYVLYHLRLYCMIRYYFSKTSETMLQYWKIII